MGLERPADAFDRARLIERLKASEGFSDRPYRDTTRHLTIGYGWNLDAVPMSRAAAAFVLAEQVERAIADLDRLLPWWREQDGPRQGVLIDLCFNMGIGHPPSPGRQGRGLRGFSRTMDALRRGDYGAAADGLRASLWYGQVGHRAPPLVEIVRTGVDA